MGSIRHRLGPLTADMSTDMFERSKALQRLLPAASQTCEKHVLLKRCTSVHVKSLVAHHLAATGHRTPPSIKGG